MASHTLPGGRGCCLLDIKTMKEVTRIPVEFVPKRNTIAMLQ